MFHHETTNQQMNERLDQLCFMPPPTDSPWCGPSVSSQQGRSKRTTIGRVSGEDVNLDLPLFWCDPSWHRIPPGTADALACGVANYGVSVAALRSELCTNGSGASFFSRSSDENAELETTRISRILPYRPERYGLSDRDFDDASIVDVRLAIRRDDMGRFAFSPEQIQRWEATPEGEPLAGGGWVPVATFPPDVPSIKRLSSKLDQLRILAPSAAVFCSIGPFSLDEDLPRIAAANPDGVIVRLDDLPLDGLRLAMTVRHCCELARQSGSRDLPVWIAPGPITPDDAAKLLLLGASGIAIDHWCEPLIHDASQTTAPSSYGYSPNRADTSHLDSLVDSALRGPTARCIGLLESTRGRPLAECLATLSPTWARALDVPELSLPRNL